MIEEAFRNILWATAASSGLGAFIDFVIGKQGQRKVKSWLELHWYRLADFRWREFGAFEAAACGRFLAFVFGRRLLSWRRAGTSALTLLICLSLCYRAIVKSRVWPVPLVALHQVPEKSEANWMQYLSASGLTKAVGGSTWDDTGKLFFEISPLGHKFRTAYFHGRKQSKRAEGDG